jgi:hypothetical protein
MMRNMMLLLFWIILLPTIDSRNAIYFMIHSCSNYYTTLAHVLVKTLICLNTTADIVALIDNKMSCSIADEITSWNLPVIIRKGKSEILPFSTMVNKTAKQGGCKGAYQCQDTLRLEVWKDIHYEKIMMLDVDMLVNRNIDSVFDLLTGDYFMAKSFFSCPINNGFLLFKPGLERHHEMVKYRWETPFSPKDGWNHIGLWRSEPNALNWATKIAGVSGSQGFHRYYFDAVKKIWISPPDKWYNKLNYVIADYYWNITDSLDDIYIFHFTGRKPFIDSNRARDGKHSPRPGLEKAYYLSETVASYYNYVKDILLQSHECKPYETLNQYAKRVFNQTW